ncbi:MAG TPA: VanW family protein, partial [Dehalococcoidia bacterium]|nr:VanW family protein [Dehalococcoidia bacterium]
MNPTLPHDHPTQPTIQRPVPMRPTGPETPDRDRPTLRPGPSPVTVAALVLGGLLLVLIAGFVFYQMSYADRIYPGVQVDGVDVGGYTRAEARAKLAEHVAQYTEARVTFRHGDQVWQPTLAEAGAVIDPQALTNLAYSMGRSGSPVQQLRKQYELFFEAQSADLPKLTFNAADRRAYFGQLSKEIDRPAINSRVTIAPDLTVTVTPSQVGRELQIDPAQNLLSGTVQEIAGRTYDLPVKEEQPKVNEAAVEPIRARVTKMIGAPLTLQAEGKTWPLTPPQIAALIDLSPTIYGETNPDRAIRVDPGKLRSILDPIDKDLKVEPVNAQLEWKDNRAQIREPGRNGRQLDLDQAQAIVLERLASDNRTVPLPVTVVEPMVSEKSLPNLGIKEVVKRTETSFAGSIPPRAHNIRLAAQKLNNQLVLPGQIFSFNEALGPTTLDAGWQVGYGIAAVGDGEHKTVPSVAGGICQVATTLFQSVFWAGYQLEERYFHLYWIEGYGQPPDGLPGLDATVDAPALDFKFKNTTDKPILIHAGTDGDKLFFELISTRPDWQVQVDPPKITNVRKADTKTVQQQDPSLPAGQQIWVEHAVDGFDAEIVRRVIKQGEEPRTLTLVSRYQPSNNVVLVGTGGRPAANTTPGPNSTPGPNTTPGPNVTPAAGQTPPAGG